MTGRGEFVHVEVKKRGSCGCRLANFVGYAVLRSKYQRSLSGGAPQRYPPLHRTATFRRPQTDGKRRALQPDVARRLGLHFVPTPQMLNASQRWTNGSIHTLTDTAVSAGHPSQRSRACGTVQPVADSSSSGGSRLSVETRSNTSWSDAIDDSIAIVVPVPAMDAKALSIERMAARSA